MTPDFIGESAKATQRQALLYALRAGPVSTIAARDLHGIASPAPRVLELRRAGFPITTGRVTAADLAGRLHTVALYRLATDPCTYPDADAVEGAP